jgi:lipid-binding SYLF domain-containing protein
MKKFVSVLSLCSCALLVRAADTPQERMTDAAQVFNEIMATPDKGIPEDLLEKAHCIVIVPGLKQAAFGVGGKFGRGYAICRRERAGWGAPAAIRVEGGSFGFQIGASSTDVIMLVMNERGMRRLMEDKFTLGGEATVAAGPITERKAPAEARALISALNHYSRYEEKDKPIESRAVDSIKKKWLTAGVGYILDTGCWILLGAR